MSMQVAFQPIDHPGHPATAEHLREYLQGVAPATVAARSPAESLKALIVPRGLVDLRAAAPGVIVLPAPAWSDPEVRFLVRPEVAERLVRAANALPANLRLGFWEGLRPV